MVFVGFYYRFLEQIQERRKTREKTKKTQQNASEPEKKTTTILQNPEKLRKTKGKTSLAGKRKVMRKSLQRAPGNLAKASKYLALFIVFLCSKGKTPGNPQRSLKKSPQQPQNLKNKNNKKTPEQKKTFFLFAIKQFV